MPDINPTAANGFAKAAKAYASGRPDYPPALQAWLRQKLRLAPGRTVLDLGSGTGKFLPLLLETGAYVIAIEPVGPMRAELVARFPEADAREGTATAIPVPDASVDAVTCAQSFHWFANAAALAEIRRVLKPGGVLGLIWNQRDESVDWVAALQALVESYKGRTPRHEHGEWRSVFPAPGFGPVEEAHFSHTHRGTPEQVIVDRTLSISYVASLPDAKRTKLAREIETLIAQTPALAGKDVVSFPYETLAIAVQKID